MSKPVTCADADDRAFRDDGLLICLGLWRGDQQSEEQSKCTHALGESKE